MYETLLDIAGPSLNSRSDITPTMLQQAIIFLGMISSSSCFANRSDVASLTEAVSEFMTGIDDLEQSQLIEAVSIWFGRHSTAEGGF